MSITQEPTKYIYVKVQDADVGKQYTLKVNRNDARRLRLRKIKAVVQKVIKELIQTTLASSQTHNAETEKNNESNNESNNNSASESNEKTKKEQKEVKKKKKKEKSSFDLYCGTIKFSNDEMCLEEIMQQCYVYQKEQQRSSNATNTSLYTEKSFIENEKTFASSHSTEDDNSNNIESETYQEHLEELEEKEECILTIHRYTTEKQKESNGNKEKMANNHEKLKVNQKHVVINASHHDNKTESEKYKQQSVQKENTHTQHRPPLAPPSPINGGTPRERMTRTTPSPLKFHQSGKIVVENSQSEECNHVFCPSDKATSENKEVVHHLTSSSASCEQEQQLLDDANNNEQDNEFYCEDAESKASLTVSVSSRSESESDYELDNENSINSNINYMNNIASVKAIYEEKLEEPAHIIYNSATVSKINKEIVHNGNNSSNDDTPNHNNDTNNVTEYIEHLENQVKELQEKLQVFQCKTNESEANVIS